MSTTTTDWRDRFITHLEALKQREDRGALADLRRGLGEPPGTVASMYRHVIPWIPQNQFLEDAAYTVASLFGLHPESGGTRSIGGALGAIRTNDGNAPPESIEQRFITLLNSHEDDLPVHLRQAISLLKTHDIPLDWRRLIRDIQGWTHPDRYVQKRWARDFWTRGQTTGAPTELTEDPNGASTPTEE